MPEYILIIDEKDNVVGKEEKVKCHLGNGILHRAFTLMVFNDKNELLITKRSKEKMLWPNIWDGSISSHLHEGESYEDAARRRCPDELGIKCDGLKFLFKIRYQAQYKDIGSENEINAVLVAKGINEVFPNKKEISEYKYIDLKELEKDMKKNPEKYAPWFILIFEKFMGLQPK
ncbi:MAG: isopentenyl-diphosphate Delta-isomerase [Candidatus Aenigmarchaeota archaeon]|nr:isopentenyl-diphosphate Delta-isomerase [Candidatus Aenigmarchaeota archaeon]